MDVDLQILKEWTIWIDQALTGGMLFSGASFAPKYMDRGPNPELNHVYVTDKPYALLHGPFQRFRTTSYLSNEMRLTSNNPEALSLQLKRECYERHVWTMAYAFYAGVGYLDKEEREYPPRYDQLSGWRERVPRRPTSRDRMQIGYESTHDRFKFIKRFDEECPPDFVEPLWECKTTCQLRILSPENSYWKPGFREVADGLA